MRRLLTILVSGLIVTSAVAQGRRGITEAQLKGRTRVYTQPQDFTGGIGLPACAADPPTGSCTTGRACVDDTNDFLYVCVSSAWVNTGADTDTLDGLDSLQFIRADVSDVAAGTYTFTASQPIIFSLDNTQVDFGTDVPSNAPFLRWKARGTPTVSTKYQWNSELLGVGLQLEVPVGSAPAATLKPVGGATLTLSGSPLFFGSDIRSDASNFINDSTTANTSALTALATVEQPTTSSSAAILGTVQVTGGTEGSGSPYAGVKGVAEIPAGEGVDGARAATTTYGIFGSNQLNHDSPIAFAADSSHLGGRVEVLCCDSTISGPAGPQFVGINGVVNLINDPGATQTTRFASGGSYLVLQTNANFTTTKMSGIQVGTLHTAGTITDVSQIELVPVGITGATNYRGIWIKQPAVPGYGSVINDSITVEASAQAAAGDGNIRFVGGDWNTGHSQLNTGHIWATSGEVRISDGAPTTATDYDLAIGSTGINATTAITIDDNKVTTEQSCTHVATVQANPGTDATAFLSLNDSVASLTETVVDDWYAPVDLFGGQLRALVNIAPGAGESFTVTLRDDGADAGSVECVISDTATTCGPVAAWAAIAGGSKLNLEVNVTAGGADAAELLVAVCFSPDI